MVMLLSITKNEESSLFSTRTEIYSAFMNMTVKHFSDRHPDWNTVSLWECILKFNMSDLHGNELCIAFKELHHIAFEMFFNRVDKFPDQQEINSNINKLGFVNVMKVDSNRDEVKYTFYHPTFQEFFVAIHLLGLKQEELLYLHIKERQEGRLWQRTNPWLFYFGLVGAYYREDNVSAILKQLSMYRQMRENCVPFCHDKSTFKYIQEIGWTGKKLDELLESAGIVANSTLYVDFNIDTVQGYLHILNHATTINELTIEYACGKFYREDSNQNVVSYAECLLECLINKTFSETSRASLNIPKIRNLSSETTTHFHFKLFWFCKSTFSCLLLRTLLPYHSLHIHLSNNDFSHETRLLALALIRHLKRNLRSLSLTFGPLSCGDLAQYINFLNSISSEYQLIHEFEITIWPHALMNIEAKNDSCLRMLITLFNKVKRFHKLRKLAVTNIQLPKLVVDDGSLASDILQNICELNGLQTLELQGIGASGVEKLSWCLPHTLLELSLCENSITDCDLNAIAQRLKDLYELKSLNLCKNDIEGGSLRSLVEALSSHQNFSSLDLSHNPVSDSDGIEALGNLRNLRELKLKHSRVKVKDVVDALLPNNDLYSLSITGNVSVGISSIQSLVQLTNLRHLDMSEEKHVMLTKMPHETAIIVVEILEKMTKLQSFTLCSHRDAYSRHWNIDLARAISHHPHLQHFYAPCLFEV